MGDALYFLYCIFVNDLFDIDSVEGCGRLTYLIFIILGPSEGEITLLLYLFSSSTRSIEISRKTAWGLMVFIKHIGYECSLSLLMLVVQFQESIFQA